MASEIAATQWVAGERPGNPATSWIAAILYLLVDRILNSIAIGATAFTPAIVAAPAAPTVAVAAETAASAEARSFVAQFKRIAH